VRISIVAGTRWTLARCRPITEFGVETVFPLALHKTNRCPWEISI
jgi:hypothetical protein